MLMLYILKDGRKL